MSKWLLLFILLLFIMGFWRIIPLYFFFDSNWMLLFLLLYCFFILKKYRRDSPIFKTRNYIIIFYIWGGVLLSFIPAFVLWGQSFFTSFFYFRWFLGYLTIPAMLALYPSEDDIFKALNLYSLVYFCVFLINTFVPFPIFGSKLDFIEEYGFLDESQFIRSDLGDIGYISEGLQLVIVNVCFILKKMSEKITPSLVLYLLIIIVQLFLYQNRSALICVAMVLFFYIFFNSKRNRVAIILTSFFLILFFYEPLIELVLPLVEETSSQMGDSDYNRNYAYYIMLTTGNVLTHLLGNGFLPTDHPYTFQLNDWGVYHSDVGFIGFWHRYGIIPIFGFLSFLLPPLFNKRMPFCLKYYALCILLSAFTVSYFEQPRQSHWFYLYCYYLIFCQYNYGNEKQKKRVSCIQ